MVGPRNSTQFIRLFLAREVHTCRLDTKLRALKLLTRFRFIICLYRSWLALFYYLASTWLQLAACTDHVFILIRKLTYVFNDKKRMKVSAVWPRSELPKVFHILFRISKFNCFALPHHECLNITGCLTARRKLSQLPLQNSVYNMSCSAHGTTDHVKVS